MLQKIAIQMAIKTSRSSKCNCNTKSALDKIWKPKPILKSKNYFYCIQPTPDLGKEFNQPVNIANNIKGKAKARET